MIIHEELEQIAEKNAEIIQLTKQLSEKTEIEDLYINQAEFIECVEKDGHLYSVDGGRLDNCGMVDNEYYCEQYSGWSEDHYHGKLYYATKKKNIFVAVPFMNY